MSLRSLAQNATPGPWNIYAQAGSFASLASADDEPVCQAYITDASLISLAPEMAVLLADMAEALRDALEKTEECHDCLYYHHDDGKWNDALARFDALDAKAGEGA